MLKEGTVRFEVVLLQVLGKFSHTKLGGRGGAKSLHPYKKGCGGGGEGAHYVLPYLDGGDANVFRTRYFPML